MKNTLFGTGFLNRLIYWYWAWKPNFFVIKKIVFFFNISNQPNRLNCTTKNCTAIGRKTDPRQCALVPIMKILISIGLVINLEKNRPYQTTHTPNSGTLELWEVLTWLSEGIWPTPHRCSLLGLLFLCCVDIVSRTWGPCDLLVILFSASSFPIQDTHVIRGGINLNKGGKAQIVTKKMEYVWNDLWSTKAQKSL